MNRVPQAGLCSHKVNGNELTFTRMPPRGERPDMVDMWVGPYDVDSWVKSTIRITLEEFIESYTVIATYQ